MWPSIITSGPIYQKCENIKHFVLDIHSNNNSYEIKVTMEYFAPPKKMCSISNSKIIMLTPPCKKLWCDFIYPIPIVL